MGGFDSRPPPPKAPADSPGPKPQEAGELETKFSTPSEVLCLPLPAPGLSAKKLSAPEYADSTLSPGLPSLSRQEFRGLTALPTNGVTRENPATRERPMTQRERSHVLGGARLDGGDQHEACAADIGGEEGWADGGDYFAAKRAV